MGHQVLAGRPPCPTRPTHVRARTSAHMHAHTYARTHRMLHARTPAACARGVTACASMSNWSKHARVGRSVATALSRARAHPCAAWRRGNTAWPPPTLQVDTGMALSKGSGKALRTLTPTAAQMAARETGFGAVEQFMHAGKLLALELLVRALESPHHHWPSLRPEARGALARPAAGQAGRQCFDRQWYGAEQRCRGCCRAGALC